MGKPIVTPTPDQIAAKTTKLRYAQLLLVGVKATSLFLNGADKPLRDEDNNVVLDPNRKRILLADGDSVMEFTIKIADLNGVDTKIGKVVTVVFATVQDFNNNEEFLYSIG